MLIRIPKGWELPDRLASPETVFLNRRGFIGKAGATALAAALLPRAAGAAVEATSGLYPAPLNPAFAEAGRAVTPEALNTSYNNFYEFGTSKRIAKAAEALKVSPWDVVIDGEVETRLTIGFDDLIARMPLEDRVYRHRCVEAWAMVVPWSGFAVRHLVELAKPTARARYVRFESFYDPNVAPGQKPGLFNLASAYPWPYSEAITLEEAMNDLAFVATGAYGKPLPKPMGAPMRLHLPWKYGFKSAKSVRRISFLAERPTSLWEAVAGNEYGFWANINPDVPHPRWSQARERILGTDEEVPTVKFNGYGEFVADLYAGLGGEGDRLWR